MASMKDVARLAGVSVSTVSRAISGNITVDPSTKRRVLQAIEKTDYRPNLLAQGLRLRNSNTIGLVLPALVHEAFATFLKYVEAECAHHGYLLAVGNTHSDAGREEEFIQQLLQRNVDGIVLSRVSDYSRVFKMIERQSVKAVLLDRRCENDQLPSVEVDNVDAGRVAAEHLIERGHRAIAMITGPQSVWLSRERTTGFTDRLLDEGIAIDPRNIVEGDFDFPSGVEAARLLLEKGAPFTAVWAQSDLMAIGFLHEMQRRKISVPADISVIGMDDIAPAHMSWPPLTTIAQPFEEMGRRAVDLITSMIEADEVIYKRSILDTRLVERESVRSV